MSLFSLRTDQSAHVMPGCHVPQQRREIASEAVTGAWGRAGPRLYAGRAAKPAAGHRARLTTLGICCTAPKSRSKATIRVIRVARPTSAARAKRSSPGVHSTLCANCGSSGGAKMSRAPCAVQVPGISRGDLIVVPGAVAENVALKSDAELPIDRAGGNCNVVVPVTFPEQHRTALLAESSPPRIA